MSRATGLKILSVWLVSTSLVYAGPWYGSKLCKKFSDDFYCYKVKRHDTWDSLFSEPQQLDLAKRINRIGDALHPGMIIAIPKTWDTNLISYSPLPRTIKAPGEPEVIVSLSQQAWVAYDADGDQIKWGPASTAKGYCPDIHKGCHTPAGTYHIYTKGGADCSSTKFPVHRGGAPMPYCMFFHGGFALHGSHELPGYNASHGCVRMMVPDAEWLNHEFTSIGTKVIVEP